MGLADCMRRIAAAGLSAGTSGNVSVRTGTGMCITPSGVEPALLHAGSGVAMRLDGSDPNVVLHPTGKRIPGLVPFIHAEIQGLAESTVPKALTSTPSLSLEEVVKAVPALAAAEAESRAGDWFTEA